MTSPATCATTTSVGASRRTRIDSVFHLAAQAIIGNANASPVPTFETNIEGTWVLLEDCSEAGVEVIVVASSDKAYGPHDELPYNEDSALQPIYPYDVSKAATDLIARSYWHTYRLPVAVTRLANLYGGGDRNFSRLIPETVTAVLDGRRPVIRSDGCPSATSSMSRMLPRHISRSPRRWPAAMSAARRSTRAGAGRIRFAKWSI